MPLCTYRTYRITSLLSLFLLLLATACEDIFEEDLTDKRVVLITPGSNLETTTLTQFFSWEEVEAALQYEFQVAQPSFDSIDRIVVDSTITNTKFELTLTPGTYQWRVKALNGSSETEYTTACLQIDSTSNLVNQVMVLRSPADGFMTSNTNPAFEWESLSGIDQYSFLMVEDDFETGSLFTSEILTTNESITLPIALSEGYFEWGVRGENALSNTLYFVRSIWVDTTAPAPPTLLSPIANATVPDSIISFSWQQNPDNGTPLTDSLFIYRDSLKNNLVRAVVTSGSSYQDSLGVGDYFWSVHSTDGAFNRGSLPTLRKLTVQ